ncbi:olfactory receptor 4C11-like [Dasypus novemcinctus]|uniref:olfactory receptor 4C11-like n=1 Tax=Dasypus novemcinctus TaxID=9361 RepID=UPI00265ED376|nr:olfactory receptor 4C11-like [Dasypus novemcinctus]
MGMNSSVNMFILLGLIQDILKEKVVFVIFLFLYLATLLANLLIVMTIKYRWMLGSPMYFFLFYLSFANTCIFTTTAPRLIIDALTEKKITSYNECMVQIFAVHFFGCMEILVLILRSFDHYMAICKSLRYTTIMSIHVCGILFKLAWVRSCIHSSAQIILVLKLPFCDPNVIDHYLSDIQPLQPLLKLACMDSYFMNILIDFTNGAICTVSFIILLISHILILHSSSNQSAEGRKKGLYTCTSRIVVVILTFVPCIFIYAHPPTIFPVDKMVGMFYTIGTPLLNPLIYTLRNAEIKNAMKKLWCKKI